MTGRIVRPKLSEFHADVTGPFELEVSYSVPRDIHATIFVDRYLTLPWRREIRSNERIELVTEPSRQRQTRILSDASHGQTRSPKT